MNSLTSHFSLIKDPRQISKVEHDLLDIIVLCIVGVLCGAEGWHDIEMVGHARIDWFKERGLLQKGVPVDDTIARIISRISPDQLQACFIKWMKSIAQETKGKVIAIDGKTLRHSFDKKKGKSAIHMVSAFATANGVVLGQKKTKEKSNEITAIPELLQLIDIKGGIVTIDAMGCQKDIAKKIISKEADYVLAVKDNQKNLHEDIQDFFGTAREHNFNNVNYDYFEEVTKGHGRIEKRKYWLSNTLDSIGKINDWEKLNCIGMAESERTVGDRTSIETRFFITSLECDARSFGNAVREHWAIENKLHWVLDVSFNEDASRIRRDYSSENMGVFRHIVLNALRNDKSIKKSLKAKRFKAALESTYASKVLDGIF